MDAQDAPKQPESRFTEKQLKYGGITPAAAHAAQLDKQIKEREA